MGEGAKRVRTVISVNVPPFERWSRVGEVLSSWCFVRGSWFLVFNVRLQDVTPFEWGGIFRVDGPLPSGEHC